MHSFASSLALGIAVSLSACSNAKNEATTYQEEAGRAAALAALAAEHGSSRYLVPVSAADISQGPSSALVTIVAFLDYTEYEAATLFAIDELLAEHPDELRVVIKYCTNEPKAFGTRAVLAAHAQGRAWPMHEQIVERMRQQDNKDITQIAKDAGVPDIERFQQDRRADPPPELARQAELAERLGVDRTPVLFVNGAAYGPVFDTAQLTTIFVAERELAQRLVDAGARPDEVYSAFMVHAATERESVDFGATLPTPYNGPALASRTLASGTVVDDIESGDGRAVTEGTLVRFNFSVYSDSVSKPVMGTGDEPVEMVLNPTTRERGPITNEICDALLGQKQGGKLRVRIPAEIVERDTPPARPKRGDLWLTLELVEVTDGASSGAQTRSLEPGSTH